MLPLVTIVMAMYKPNIEWLVELLQSLNEQTCSNLELLVWNDCPEDNNHYEIFQKYITKFPYKIYQGKKNLGSNGAFEELTKVANGQYIAYCDQDDIWCKEKLDILLNEIKKTKTDLVYSDMYVIDEKSRIVSDSIGKVRKHHVFQNEKSAFQQLIRKNFVTGCTILIKTEMAKKSLPFPSVIFHDWWLALYSSAYGKIHFINQPLIKYRIYGTNQSSILKGVDSKRDYYDKRIVVYKKMIEEVQKQIGKEKGKACIGRCVDWGNCRVNYFQHPGWNTFCKLFEKRNMGNAVTVFELLLPFLPDFFFRLIINQIRKNRI